MRYTFILCLCLFYFSAVYGQLYPEFSSLSGRVMNSFSSAKIGDTYIYQLAFQNYGTVVYAIGETGELLDSMAIPNSMGELSNIDDRLFFTGIEWDENPFTSTRQVFTEYDAQLNLIQKVAGASLQPVHGPIIFEQTPTLINQRSGSFNYYNDTLFSFQKYLVVDTPQVFLGIVNVYTKTGPDGTVYARYPLEINALRNAFFVENRLFVQGSAYISPFEPRALAEFNANGALVRGIDYDAYGSGDFFDGASGDWHNGRFYFTYVAYDPSIAGCPDDNAAIDIRNDNWEVLHRFKLPDCGYLVSGKMPFSFDAQDNVFYAAPHESYKKIMVYKFTPDFQLTWKKELNFDQQDESFFPLAQLPTSDGGILLNCYKLTQAGWALTIFKLSADGDLISATELPPTAGPQPQAALAFPNPTSGSLFIMPDFAMATLARITTLSGQWIADFELQPGAPIHLSTYPQGAYLLSLWNADQKQFLGAQVIIKK